MRHSIQSLLGACVLTALTACGGGGGTTAANSTVTGQFVDAPVAGLSYKCGTSTTLGTTDATGHYTCNTGESVGFYVGDILLGSVASAQAVVTPLDLVGPGATPTDATVTNIVRFLLSISTTDTAGNLVLDPNAGTNAKGKQVDFKTIAAADLDTMITTVKPGATPTTLAAAQNHMKNSIYKLFAKSYSGTFSGSSSGTWNVSISATDGSVTGTYADAVNGAGSITGQMSTAMTVSSTYDFTGTAGGNAWTGTLNVNTGVFSGTWSGGTFTGNTVASTPVTPGASGTAGYPVTASYVGKLSDGSACTVDVAPDHSVTVSATNWAYTGGTIKTTLAGFYFENTNVEIAPTVFYTGTSRFFESNAGDYQAATATAPAYNTGLSFDATSGKMIMASGQVTTDTTYPFAVGANFNFVCAGDAFPAGANIGTSDYNKAAPSSFKATNLVGTWNAPSDVNGTQACSFTVDATGNLTLTSSNFKGGAMTVPYTLLDSTGIKNDVDHAEYNAYADATGVAGQNTTGTDWFWVRIMNSTAGIKTATVSVNGSGPGSTNVIAKSGAKPIECSTGNDPAAKWAAYGAAHQGTYTGAVDKNANFTAVGTVAACTLTIATDGTTTYTGTNGKTKVVKPGTDLPPMTSDNLYYDFPAPNSAAWPTFSVSLGANSLTAQSGQVVGKNVFYAFSLTNEEYCLDMK